MVVFSLIFVADTKKIFRYNFVAPLMIAVDDCLLICSSESFLSSKERHSIDLIEVIMDRQWILICICEQRFYEYGIIFFVLDKSEIKCYTYLQKNLNGKRIG